MSDSIPVQSSPDSNDVLRRLRETFHKVNYTPTGVAERLQTTPILAVPTGSTPQFLYHTRGHDALDVIIQLFLLEATLPTDDVQTALAGLKLPGDGIAEWERAGMLTIKSERVSATMRILPYAEMYMASDLNRVIREGSDSNFVMGLGHATELLRFATVPGTGRDTLDLGTGCGALGLLAADSSKTVIGSDVNSRAVEYAKLNATLNDVGNFQAKQGDLFGPAGTRKFERILSNPPFVIAPDARYVFRDSGKRGDQFCRELAQAAPAFLSAGGYFQMLSNCPHIRGRDWRDDWAEWFANTGCDTIVWANKTVTPAEYASTWIRDTELGDSAELGLRTQRYDTWMNYFDSQQFEAISYGVVTMRRRDATDNFIYIDDTQREIIGPCGTRVRDAFEVEDSLASSPDISALIDRRLKLTNGVQIEKKSTATSSGLEDSYTARLTGGLSDSLNIDPASAALLRLCDGKRTLREVIPELAEQFDVNVDQLANAIPSIAEHLLQRFILSFAG